MKTESIQSSIARTVIYTLGHIFIAICCIIFITGADLRLATIDAIVEPLINSVWYFILDYIWRVRVNSQRSYIGNES
ncbi:MAG: hypothetical protein CMF52_01890 [Legionellales bacterium]|jgi:uncharacterized membrane protein|nr:hypothetical protein [Legionellales bacterium]HAV93531.1 hypothetical protein [Pseudomonadota bacterium]